MPSSARARLSLAVVGLLSLVAPIAAIVLSARGIGLVGQGRYFIPLWAGVAVVAALSFRAPTAWVRRGWWLATLLVAAIAVSDAVSFFGGLRRYTVGVHGPLNPLAHVAGGWNPPLPAWSLDAAFFVAAAALAVILSRPRAEEGGYSASRTAAAIRARWRGSSTLFPSSV